MPLYTYLVAPLVAWFGPQFWPGRLVSLLSSLGLAALIAAVIRRESGRWTFAVAGAGLFLMGQGFSRGSYDTIRPDPLMLLLAFAGLATLRFSRGNGGCRRRRRAAERRVLHQAACAVLRRGRAAPPGRVGSPAAAGVRDRPAGGVRRRVRRCCRSLLGPWFSFYVYDVPSHWSPWSVVRMRMLPGRRPVRPARRALDPGAAVADAADCALARAGRDSGGGWDSGGVATGHARHARPVGVLPRADPDAGRLRAARAAGAGPAHRLAGQGSGGIGLELRFRGRMRGARAAVRGPALPGARDAAGGGRARRARRVRRAPAGVSGTASSSPRTASSPGARARARRSTRCRWTTSCARPATGCWRTIRSPSTACSTRCAAGPGGPSS